MNKYLFIFNEQDSWKIKGVPLPTKTVFVVGGGPAGMEVARTAAERGHKVTLFKKEDKLGGELFIAAQPPHKHEINSTRKYLVRQLEKSAVEIKTGVEANVKLIEEGKPDAVILATGVLHLVPKISEINGSNVMFAEDVLMGRKETGETVIVIGMGRIACETSEFLADKGNKVTVVGQGLKMAVGVGSVQRGRLLMRLREKGITLMPGVQKYEEITDEGLTLIDNKGNRQTIKVHTIVYALGVKANKRLTGELKVRSRSFIQ